MITRSEKFETDCRASRERPERGVYAASPHDGFLATKVFPTAPPSAAKRRKRRAPGLGLDPARSTLHASRSTLHSSGAFTLIELILVMAILTMMVSVSAPTLSHFFRGRTLDSEARRMLALLHTGQTRAVSEGVPMDFWVDAAQGRFGLEAERSYEPEDPKAVDLPIDSGLQIEVGSATNRPAATPMWPGQTISTINVAKVALAHPTLPTIRFLPDGSISDSSPMVLCLKNGEGASLLLAQAPSRLTYEIRNPQN